MTPIKGYYIPWFHMRHQKMLQAMARASEQALQIPELARLGEVVREQRQALGLSQEALADLAGLDHSYMGGVERGEHNIAFINLLKVSKGSRAPLIPIIGRGRLVSISVALCSYQG